jgi:hypothetical protein
MGNREFTVSRTPPGPRLLPRLSAPRYTPKAGDVKPAASGRPVPVLAARGPCGGLSRVLCFPARALPRQAPAPADHSGAPERVGHLRWLLEDPGPADGQRRLSARRVQFGRTATAPMDRPRSGVGTMRSLPSRGFRAGRPRRAASLACSSAWAGSRWGRTLIPWTAMVGPVRCRAST